MNALYSLGLWGSKIGIRQAAPWLLLYGLVCLLWAARVDPVQHGVVLAFAPIWMGWTGPIEIRNGKPQFFQA